MDALKQKFQAVKAEVSKLILPLVDHNYTLALYDLTTVRVYGKSVVKNDLRQVDKNKETVGFAASLCVGLCKIGMDYADVPNPQW